MKEFNRASASKKLSRLKLFIKDELMTLKTIWCRTAISFAEDKVARINTHSFYELHYVLNSERSPAHRVWIDGSGIYDLSVGDFIIVPNNIRHYTQFLSANCEKLVCGFVFSSDNEIVRESMERLCTSGILHGSDEMAELVELMLAEAARDMPFASDYVSRLLECLLVGMMRTAKPDIWITNEKHADAEFENDIRIREIHRFISENISRGITGDDVAEHLSISLRHLNRIVNEYEHTTVSRLIDTYTADAIKTYLRDPDMSLRAIAETLGFSSEYAMNRFFKRVEGMALGMFRKSMEQ